MQLGMVGLGRMGSGMTRRLEAHGHEVKTYDPRVDSTARPLAPWRSSSSRRATSWAMVPSGDDHGGHGAEADRGRSSPATRSWMAAIPTSATRSAATARRGSRRSRSWTPAFRAASGGSTIGFCLMVGGDRRRCGACSPCLESLAPEDGWAHVGAVRCRPLREDGPQRDRIRPDAGVRRRLRADAPFGVRARPRGDRGYLALRLGRPLLAARAAARGLR